MIILTIIFGISIYLFISFIYSYFRLSQSKRTQKNMMKIKSLYREKNTLAEIIFGKMEHLLEDLLKKDNEVKRDTIERLQRAGINISYEKYLIQKFMTPFFVFSFFYGFSFLIEDFHHTIAMFFRGSSVLLAIFVFFDMGKQIDRKLQELRTGIIIEMPAFISTYRYSPAGKDLIDIIAEFSITSTYLKYDFDLLRADMSQHSREKALKMFAHRVNIIEVDETVSILINDLYGDRKESDINLQILQNKLIEKYQHYIEDKLKNRPLMLQSISLFSVVAVISIYVILLGYGLIESMKEMF